MIDWSFNPSLLLSLLPCMLLLLETASQITRLDSLCSRGSPWTSDLLPLPLSSEISRDCATVPGMYGFVPNLQISVSLSPKSFLCSDTNYYRLLKNAYLNPEYIWILNCSLWLYLRKTFAISLANARVKVESIYFQGNHLAEKTITHPLVELASSVSENIGNVEWIAKRKLSI